MACLAESGSLVLLFSADAWSSTVKLAGGASLGSATKRGSVRALTSTDGAILGSIGNARVSLGSVTVGRDGGAVVRAYKRRHLPQNADGETCNK